MIDYQKLLSNIPNLKHGDLVLTNSYDFAGVLPSNQNLIYINNFKNFCGERYLSDWIISVDDIEYSIEFEVEKGICCLENNLNWLHAEKLKYLYHQQGLYVYKIIAIDTNEPFKYFVILKKRCCSRCKFRDNSCCPNATTETTEEIKHIHTHTDKYERFDFFSFI